MVSPSLHWLFWHQSNEQFHQACQLWCFFKKQNKTADCVKWQPSVASKGLKSCHHTLRQSIFLKEGRQGSNKLCYCTKVVLLRKAIVNTVPSCRTVKLFTCIIYSICIMIIHNGIIINDPQKKTITIEQLFRYCHNCICPTTCLNCHHEKVSCCFCSIISQPMQIHVKSSNGGVNADICQLIWSKTPKTYRKNQYFNFTWMCLMSLEHVHSPQH